MSTKRKQLNIGIVTFPLLKSGITPLSNLVDILYPLSGDFYLITGNAGAAIHSNRKKFHVYLINHTTEANMLIRIINFAYTQLRISYKLARVTKHVQLWFLFLGEGGLLLPMLTTKLLRKKTVLVSAASNQRISTATKDPLSWPTTLLEKLNRSLANCIILYSPNHIKEWNLEKYKDKILIAHEHFLDFNKFNVKKKLSERNNLVGYIGRLSEEKGILNFVKAIPEILNERDDLEFLICGDGQLRDEIEKYISEKNLKDKVKLAGWIPHGNLPDYLNELKLVVLPSFTEGLPNIMLEAMACGTPVLATSVGAISDVIKDGETGFIMENNSPEHIARNVIRILEQPDLDKIVENARALVEQEFTYKAVVKRYKKILSELRG